MLGAGKGEKRGGRGGELGRAVELLGGEEGGWARVGWGWGWGGGGVWVAAAWGWGLDQAVDSGLHSLS